MCVTDVVACDLTNVMEACLLCATIERICYIKCVESIGATIHQKKQYRHMCMAASIDAHILYNIFSQ